MVALGTLSASQQLPLYTLSKTATDDTHVLKIQERKQKRKIKNNKVNLQSYRNVNTANPHRVSENVKAALPVAEQIYRCLKKEQLCSAWCHLLLRLPPYSVQCLRSCLAVTV